MVDCEKQKRSWGAARENAKVHGNFNSVAYWYDKRSVCHTFASFALDLFGVPAPTGGVVGSTTSGGHGPEPQICKSSGKTCRLWP